MKLNEENKKRLVLSKNGKYYKDLISGAYLPFFGKCVICNDDFVSQTNSKYCGRPCAIRGNEKMMNVLKEKNPFWGKHHTIETKQKLKIANTGRKHTEETKRKYRENRKGEKNGNYKGGQYCLTCGKKMIKGIRKKCFECNQILKKKSKERRLLIGDYPGNWYSTIRKNILKRDNYICQNPYCKKKFKRLEVHHIDGIKTNNENDNLITLCNKCHSKTYKDIEIYKKFYKTLINEIKNKDEP